MDMEKDGEIKRERGETERGRRTNKETWTERKMEKLKERENAK